MGEQEDIAAHRISGDQKPTAEPFLQCVIRVTETGLRNLYEKRVCVFQQQIAQEWIPPEFLIESSPGNTICISPHLNNRAIGRDASQDCGNTYHSFITYRSY